MADPAGDPSDRLHGFASGFHATYYVYTGVACGLFEALVDPRTPAALAAARDLHEPYVRTFCDAGLRWGLLTVDPPAGETAEAEPTFRLAEGFVDALAEPDSPRYVGDLFRFLGGHQSHEYASYPASFESGERHPAEERGRAFTEVIEGSTRGLQDVFLDHLLPELPAFESRLDRGGRLLDVGCGTGRLVCRLCERFPAVEGVGVDLDGDAVALASERADREGVADRAAFRTADAATVEGPFAAVVCFMSLHEIDPGKRRPLFERLGDALADDGVVVVFDEVYPDRYDRFDRQPFAAGVETQWSELTWGADVPTDETHRDLLAAAGCEECTSRTVADRFAVYEGVRS